MAYKFMEYLCDPTPQIEGKDYENLLKVCFFYSTYFSLIYFNNSEHLVSLEPYIITSSFVYSWPETGLTDRGGLMEVYKCNRETQTILMNLTNNMMSWNSCFEERNPEDLAFYRSDKSVFFASKIHEGECYLYPKKNESVESIIVNKGWRPIENELIQNKVYF